MAVIDHLQLPDGEELVRSVRTDAEDPDPRQRSLERRQAALTGVSRAVQGSRSTEEPSMKKKSPTESPSRTRRNPGKQRSEDGPDQPGPRQRSGDAPEPEQVPDDNTPSPGTVPSRQDEDY